MKRRIMVRHHDSESRMSTLRRAPLSPCARRQRRERIAASALFVASFGGVAALAFLPIAASPFVALASIVAGTCAALCILD